MEQWQWKESCLLEKLPKSLASLTLKRKSSLRSPHMLQIKGQKREHFLSRKMGDEIEKDWKRQYLSAAALILCGLPSQLTLTCRFQMRFPNCRFQMRFPNFLSTSSTRWNLEWKLEEMHVCIEIDDSTMPKEILVQTQWISMNFQRRLNDKIDLNTSRKDTTSGGKPHLLPLL